MSILKLTIEPGQVRIQENVESTVSQLPSRGKPYRQKRPNRVSNPPLPAI